MDNSHSVTVYQSIKDRCDNVSCLLLCKLFLSQYLIEQFTTSHQFHNQKEVLFVLVNVMQLHNIGMVDLLQNVYLVLETNTVFLGHFSPKGGKKG